MIVIVYHVKIHKRKFYSYFDGKTQFLQIFLDFVFFLWGGGEGGGQITASFTCVMDRETITGVCSEGLLISTYAHDLAQNKC